MTTTSNTDIQELKDFIKDGFNQLDCKIDNKFNELDKKIDNKFNELDKKIDRVINFISKKIRSPCIKTRPHYFNNRISKFKQAIALPSINFEYAIA